MKTLTTLATAILFSATTMNVNANNMDDHIHNALVDTCKAAMSGNTLRFERTVKEYRLDKETVALGVVCNGQDIIAFAESHGANKTAERLSDALGQASITDLASIEKFEVNFVTTP
ncbi:DUF3718 domain-containing protein [Thalassotalea sp. Y01]|uniref:DUF3718 domain-containing protein n=1 Tax=Thalassotalea sp. Y01 TaxID=2729613 RepID=UPI00145E1694|nr:DUF3718 domain-containing protein [Thalassotalea sp. Y01]NMP14722.1 DUF3718 domain-containing protein [Thalassotalea sp. Y01]